MIIQAKNENIFETEANHIAFAVNTEGINDSGFAGMVARKGWPELAYIGKDNEQEFSLGTVLSKKIGEKTYHALVCHSLVQNWGDNQADVIKQCFDNIESHDEPVATIAIGTGLVGMLSGADFRQIVVGMHESEKEIILYSQYTMEAVQDCIIEENEKVAIKTIKKQIRK